MIQEISALISKNRKFIPLSATAILILIAYTTGAILYPGMRNPQVFLNLFRNNTYLLISAIGMTFVILTGGIDLSVSGVIALTTVAAAALIREGVNAWIVILLMLAMGTTLGAIMGSFVAYMKVQPFIATLAGMWFARGMCFFISDDAIPINNRIYKLLGQTKLLIPGWTELAARQGNPAPYISILVVVAFFMLALAMVILHFTRFGRSVYAIGGNPQSARLMGLPVERTLLIVYAFSGFCSGLAGICWSIFVASGHGFYADGFEMDSIASVVIGGTMLTGGTGYVFGTLLGTMVLAVTQVLIQFAGSLSSWWSRIVIGILTLAFISVQSILSSRGEGRKSVLDTALDSVAQKRRQKQVFIGVGVGVMAISAFIFVPRLFQASRSDSAGEAVCNVAPFREDEIRKYLDDGAVIVYNRTAGANCVDELYAYYPDGRVIANNGEGKPTIESQVDPAQVANVIELAENEYKWFTNYMYSTYHNPCRQCYAHYLVLSNAEEEKGVTAVDGGTDMPAEYGYTLSVLRPILPKFDPMLP